MNLAKFATMDPIVLLSIVNMKLRDEFSTLDDLCRYFEIDRKALSTTLKNLGYEYQAEENQFK